MTRTIFLSLLLLVLPTDAVLEAQPASSAVGIGNDGQQWAGQLIDVEQQGELTFSDGQEHRRLPASQLAYWGRLAKPGRGAWFMTHGGCFIVADIVDWTRQHVVLESLSWQRTRLPLSSLSAIVLSPPVSPAAQDRLLQRLAGLADRDDVVLLAGGDIVRGAVLGFSTGETRSGGILLQVSGQPEPITLPRARVLAVVPAAARNMADDRSRWIVGLADGSRLVTRSISSDKGRLRCQLDEDIALHGQPAVLDPAAPGAAWREVVYLRPVSERVRYLSDIEPIGYKHIPLLSTRWPYRMDRSVSGGRLSSAGSPYEKGIGMHSTSRLAFDLPAGSSLFQAELALDDAAGRRGSVVFLVYLQAASSEQDEAEWTLAYQSPVIRGRDRAEGISVSLADAERLALVVQHADRGDLQDHANWLHARIVLEPPPE